MEEMIKAFIKETVESCIAQLTEDQKNSIRDDPYAIDYHFGYCMYIRNQYIYPNLDRLGSDIDPDDLSGTIMQRIISRITGYDSSDMLMYRLCSHEEFIRLRREYRKRYGELPEDFLSKYRAIYPENGDRDLIYIQLLGCQPPVLTESDYRENDENWNKYVDEVIQKERVIADLIMELRNMI